MIRSFETFYQTLKVFLAFTTGSDKFTTGSYSISGAHWMPNLPIVLELGKLEWPLAMCTTGSSQIHYR